MPHTAFNPVILIEKLPFKIESVESWGSSKLVIGTDEGVLFIYEAKAKPDVDQKSALTLSLVHAQRNFSKRPVVQLSVIEEYSLLISLSNDVISVHDLPSLSLRTQINKSKGCHLFTVEQTKDALYICAAIRKKLNIFVWDIKQSDFIEVKELAVPDMAKTLTWCGESICIGFRREYNLIHVQTGAMTELFPTGKSGTPLATLLPEGQILLGRDNVSIFIGFDGKPTRKYGIMWTETPSIVAYSNPYVIAILSKFVEVRPTSDRPTLMQTIALRGARLITMRGEDIYVAAQNALWKLIPVPLSEQVNQLVAEKEYEEALHLCESMPAENNLTKESIKVLYSYHLFTQGQYERAMETFKELDVDTFQVLGLFPNLLPRDLKSKLNYPLDIPDITGPALDKASQALVNYLTSVRPLLIQKAAKDAKKGDTNNPITPLGPAGEDDYSSTTDILCIVDTSLLKSYLKINLVELTQFVKRPNYCHIKECEKVLTTYKRFQELVYLYQGRGMHKQALELLSKLGQVVKGPDLSGPDETVKYLKQLGKKHMDLIVEYSKWVLQAYPEEAIKIFTEKRLDEEELPTGTILAHIKSFASILAVPYLEYVINVRKEPTPELHNELAISYLDIVKELKKQTPKSTSRIIAGTEPGLLGDTRKKLLAFLDTSSAYNPEKMLSRFPSDDLYEERAILFGKVDDHQLALSIYAHKLKDQQMAEQYCKKHYNVDSQEARDVYLALFKVYLNPPSDDPTAQVMLKPALALLYQHYQKIDLPQALQLLPANTPVTQLYSLFENALRDNTRQKKKQSSD